VPTAQVGGTPNGKIMQEAERRLSVSVEAIQQIPGRRLFHPLATRRRRNLRVEFQPFPDEGTVLEVEVRELQHIKLRLACLSSLRNLLHHVQEQLFHLFGPELFEHLLHEGQPTQVMDIAEAC
jgi:hypothetical protein